MKYSFVILFVFFHMMGWSQFCEHPEGNNNENPERVISHFNNTEPNTTPYASSFSRIAAGGTAMGQAPNAFGSTDIRSNVTANKKLNTIAFIHRSDFLSNSDYSNGALRYDVSFDGGTTWNNNLGPLWNPQSIQGFRPGPARYPNCAIYNPDTNTIASKANLTFYASTVNGDNGSWGGQLYGAHELSSSEVYSKTDTSGPGNGWFAVNSDYEVAGNKAIGLNFSRKSNSIDFIFKDTLIVHNGTWNSKLHQFDYKKSFIPMSFGNNNLGEPVFLDTKVAMDSVGQTGYISVLGYSSNYHTYGIIHPIVYKTIDSGYSWSPATIINLDSLVEQETNYLLLDIFEHADTNFTTKNLSNGSEHDIIVDKYGNPHICVNVFPAGHTIVNPDGSNGDEFTVVSTLNAIVDIYSTDGGFTWKSRIVGNPFSWRGEFGIAPQQTLEENRPQIAKSEDGSKLFYFWFDTDPIWGTLSNIFPDAWMCGYDVDGDYLIGGRHRLTYHGYATFGSVAPEVWTNSNGSYTAHLVTQEISANSNGDLMHPTQFFYYAAKYHNNISVKENSVSPRFELGQAYPNPTNGSSVFEINMLSKSDIALVVTSISGQVVLTKKVLNNHLGNQIIPIDIPNAQSGIYFYTVTVDGLSLTRKLIVQ